MVTHSPSSSKSFRAVLAAIAFTVTPLLFGGAALAQQPAIYAPGEPIVTGFSGIIPPNPPPATGDPLDYTFIDLAGNSMVIQQLQPNGPPQGQLIPSPPVFTAKAKDVGQVFGIALDDAPETTGAAAPNIYLSATSAFGLNIVVPDASGNLVRSKVGAPGAQFMAGQWGSAGGATGTSGSIWKVDGTTGEISLFTTIAANSGAGLGDIVFDPASQQFFVSDLDTGLIYRLGADGTILDTFDHGVNGRPNHGLAAVPDDGSEISITDPSFNTEDPKTWGFAQPERKVYGLAVHSGRVYYAVADGPQIWSIGLNPDGSFANDARWELDVTGLPSTNEVTNIVFDPEGRMILAQRGPQVGSYDYTVFAEPKTSSVVRYTREIPDDPSTPSTWVETPDSYAIGFRPEGNNASGGIALGYGYDPDKQTIGGACSAYLWSTGDSLRDNPDLADKLGPPAQVHGLQGNDRTLVRPDNDPPFSSYFTDYDGNTGDDQAPLQGHIGDVEIWQQCEGGGYAFVPPYVPPPNYVPEPPHLILQKFPWRRECYDARDSFQCGFVIRVTNAGRAPYWGPLTIEDWLPSGYPGASFHFDPTPPWMCGPTGPGEAECNLPSTLLYPGESTDLYVKVALPHRGDICRLDNAAQLIWRNGYGNIGTDSAFASILVPGVRCVPPQGNQTNLKLTKRAIDDCSRTAAGWACAYVIDVTNTGPGVYNGLLKVQDVFGTPVTSITGVPTPPWACSAVGSTLTCDQMLSNFLPGQHRLLGVKAIVSPGLVSDRKICEVRDTAKILQAPGGSSLNTNPADDSGSAVSAIPSRDCNNGSTDLSLTKTGVKCAANLVRALGPSGPSFTCEYIVTIKNEGPGAFNAPITFSDNMTGGATISSGPGITCTPAGNCSSIGDVFLPPLGSIAYVIYGHVPADTRLCRLSNTAKITSPPGGSSLNTNPGNDSGSAVLPIPNPNCDNNPQPPHLRIVKTPGDCSQTAGIAATAGISCSFTVTVTNAGPGSASGPIVVKDSPASAGPVNITSSACTPDNGAGTCTFGGTLTSGSSFGFNVKVLTSGRAAYDQQCQVNNTATIITPFGGPSANATDTVTVGLCAPQILTKPICPLSQRAPISDANPTGCCPDGSSWNGRACRGVPGHKPPPTCADQGLRGVYPNCIQPNNPTCADQGLRGIYPNCIKPSNPTCADQGLRGIYPNCVKPNPGPQCGPNSSGTYPDCSCDPGYRHRVRGDSTSACVPVPVNPGPQCPANSSGDYPRCACDTGYHHQSRSLTSACVPNLNVPPVTLQCGANSSGTYPRCVCDPGYHHQSRSLTSACIANLKVPPILLQCGAHSSGSYPDCSCDLGYRHSGRAPSSACVPIRGGRNDNNGNGNNDNGGGPNIQGGPFKGGNVLKLNPDEPVKVCPRGTVGRYPNCRPMLRVNPGLMLNNNGPANEVIR